jgi:general secretion pathway protein G
MARRRRDRTIYFPWERRGGWLQLPWTRTRPIFAGLSMVVLLLFFGMREREQTGRRSTRATLLVVHRALDAYRADNDQRCPTSLEQLHSDGYLKTRPSDAWGRPLQLTCPGRRNPSTYDLVSFGPTGDMRGLDRVE